MEQPWVSICCTTYNQESLIQDALESFVRQNTTFPFEVLVGNDCSEDGTGEVLDLYQKAYPDLIHVEHRQTNLQGKENLLQLIRKAKGAYIALCEGDDYWTDEGKLQKQIDFMRQHPGCSMCFHAAKVVTEKKHSLCFRIRPFLESQVCQAEDIVRLAGGGIPTQSKVLRREVFDVIPAWYMKAHVGDMAQDLLAVCHGEVYYMDEVMSAYRLGARHSWTRNLYTGPDILLKKMAMLQKDRDLYQSFNQDTQFVFNEVIGEVCDKIDRTILLLETRGVSALWKQWKKWRTHQSIKKTATVFCKYRGLRAYATFMHWVYRRGENHRGEKK